MISELYNDNHGKKASEYLKHVIIIKYGSNLFEYKFYNNLSHTHLVCAH